ncbi:hypothetical protein SeMB42_g03951 [Synchytrium endobioticum]|uniref:Late embryogenesis abundant protein LEA-2 subgroup domain-containing protein n=1 Tax=Synchytrium endobioticum TaxID=286115 RepID=A0A507D6D0_9FUNG|nr:hypothetical protein SeMB42_g03951 [Synchytrium endobioticum]TPX46885.1 hypothetical protein SeLEV6574_g02976 [Synchytrium endobioticum]
MMASTTPTWNRPPTYNRPPGGGSVGPASPVAPASHSSAVAAQPAKGALSHLPSFAHYGGRGLGQGAKPTSPSETAKPPLPSVTIQPPKPYRRRYCCCFSSRLRCVCCCLLFMILVLGGVALAVFLCFPRIAGVEASNPVLTSTNTPLVTTTGDVVLVRFNLSTIVSVKSNSYVDYQVQRVEVSAKPVVASVPASAVTGFGAAYDVTIAKMSTSNFTLPLSFSYTASTLTDLDPVLKVLLANCGALGSNPVKQPIVIAYTASLYINWLSWTSYRPTFSGTTSFDCSNVAKSVGF